MRFVLVGDSGQRDPEIYSNLLREHPGRVLGIYIRDVSNTTERSEAIDKLAREAREAGCDLILAVDNVAMAEHAAREGLIAERAVKAVREEQSQAERNEN